MFEKLSPIEKSDLLYDLSHKRSVWVVKTSTHQLVNATFDKIVFGKNILLKLKSDRSVISPGKTIVNFSMGGAHYFLVSTLDIKDRERTLDLSTDIYILQRRKSSRFMIPSSDALKCAIKMHAGEFTNLRAKSLELGIGGCRLVVTNSSRSFNPGDRLRIQFKLTSRFLFTLEGTVKHLTIEEMRGRRYQVFGVQFKNVNSILHKRLTIAFMEMQLGLVKNAS